MSATHDLKCTPELFEEVLAGRKTCELRLNDRDFKTGDTLHLREFLPKNAKYTGRTTDRTVTHVLHGNDFAAILSPRYVVMSIR